MRVDDRHLTGSQTAQSGKTGQTPEVERSNESRTGQGSPATGSDQVQLSELIGGLARALEAAAQQRTEKMDQLTADVSTGRYQVDSRAVSEAMLAEMRAAGAEPGT